MKNFIIEKGAISGTSGIVLLMAFVSNLSCGQVPEPKLYPVSYDSVPELKSPCFINDSVETILVVTKENKYALAPVTVKNGWLNFIEI